jgi:hypothetical protein
LIVIAQKSKRGKEHERGGCEGRMGWNLLAVSRAGGQPVKGEAMDVRLRIEEKKN